MVLRKLLPSLVCLLCLARASPIEKNLKLEMVQALLRHGARTAINCEIELVPGLDESAYEPYGMAQLTAEGMQEEYRLGQMLRERYKDFLPDIYKPEDAFAYSSGYDRTKASLQLVLASLYQPTGDLAWNDELNWMPIPVHSNPWNLDILMKPRNCPTYMEKLQQVHESREFQEDLQEHGEILQLLRSAYGNDFKHDRIMCAYWINVINKDMNLTLTKWYTEENHAKLAKLVKLYLNSLSYTDTLKRLNGGTMLRRFIENMKSAHRKIYLYGGHDKTVYSFLKANNITLSWIPDYGSSVIVEKLSDERNRVYVKLLLWSGSPKQLTTLKLENCGEACPLSEYLKIVNPYLPSKEEMRCLFENLESADIEKILNNDFIVMNKE
ncbi:venom acid phosphatase Acph-1-like [Nasonia vitripennis]|uniref:Venom acid phosphatase Acph-1 n=1 Tax=Nasonia vitripennis TaxID=7425 RepID=A0A7M7G922_NASVI|nr:venom acid phosphatase Acph-1-like [Nasonia vitripennis]